MGTVDKDGTERAQLGVLVRELRAKMGLTQRGFSLELGFHGSDSIVSNLEAGRYTPSRGVTLKLMRLILDQSGATALVDAVDLMHRAWS